MQTQMNLLLESSLFRAYTGGEDGYSSELFAFPSASFVRSLVWSRMRPKDSDGIDALQHFKTKPLLLGQIRYF